MNGLTADGEWVSTHRAHSLRLSQALELRSAACHTHPRRTRELPVDRKEGEEERGSRVCGYVSKRRVEEGFASESECVVREWVSE